MVRASTAAVVLSLGAASALVVKGGALRRVDARRAAPRASPSMAISALLFDCAWRRVSGCFVARRLDSLPFHAQATACWRTRSPTATASPSTRPSRRRASATTGPSRSGDPASAREAFRAAAATVARPLSAQVRRPPGDGGRQGAHDRALERGRLARGLRGRRRSHGPRQGAAPPQDGHLQRAHRGRGDPPAQGRPAPHRRGPRRRRPRRRLLDVLGAGRAPPASVRPPARPRSVARARPSTDAFARRPA